MRHSRQVRRANDIEHWVHALNGPQWLGHLKKLC